MEPNLSQLSNCT